MSAIHGKWTVEDIREVIRNLDSRTGLKGAEVSIVLRKTLGEGQTLGSYRPGNGLTGWRRFSFSLDYFNAESFSDLAAIDVIRHEYSHFVVDALELKSVFQETDSHGLAWQTVCGLMNAVREKYHWNWKFSKTTVEGLRNAIAGKDIPEVDIMQQLKRWGTALPSLKQRHNLEKSLVKKYTRLRVFGVGEWVVHKKFGRGKVMDTLPEPNKQRLLVEFEDGQQRFTQNRQVYKLVDGKVKSLPDSALS